ncbi:hypothetical protein Tco_0518171 [Tanacetum coccineum]
MSLQTQSQEFKVGEIPQLKHQCRSSCKAAPEVLDRFSPQLPKDYGQVICVKYDGFKVVNDGDYMQKLSLTRGFRIGIDDKLPQRKVLRQLGHSSEPDWSSSGLCSIKSLTAPLHMKGSGGSVKFKRKVNAEAILETQCESMLGSSFQDRMEQITGLVIVQVTDRYKGHRLNTSISNTP